jgi:hypothetical protein
MCWSPFTWDQLRLPATAGVTAMALGPAACGQHACFVNGEGVALCMGSSLRGELGR